VNEPHRDQPDAANLALPPCLQQAAALVAILTMTGGCARALHEPPPLVDPSQDAGQRDPERVAPLLAQAEALYASRDPEKVRKAVAIYMDAARADTTRVEGLVGAIRAESWLIDHEDDAEARRRDAISSVQAAQWCGRIAPKSAACVYWLGAALGLQARERHATVLDALPRIEEAFKKAAASEPSLEQGGPDRALALLYLRAPAWPSGVGDPDLGLEHARKAVALAPDYPPNQLALAEALTATGDATGGREAYERALELARAKATGGDPDAPDWIQEAETALTGSPPKR